MSVVVMFGGEQYWFEDIFYTFESYEIECQDSPKVLFGLVKVEETHVGGKTKRKLIEKGNFSPLMSSIDFRDSEWSMGVRNGKAK
jgi:hypothetical protein